MTSRGIGVFELYKVKPEEITEDMWGEYAATHDVNLSKSNTDGIYSCSHLQREKNEFGLPQPRGYPGYCQQGVIALMDCIEKYDYSRACSLTPLLRLGLGEV
jgi:hypothetical protein